MDQLFQMLMERKLLDHHCHCGIPSVACMSIPLTFAMAIVALHQCGFLFFFAIMALHQMFFSWEPGP